MEKSHDIFSILHDGVISTWAGNKSSLTLKINCQYLAERIDASFDSFFVTMTHVNKIELITWPNPIDLPVLTLTDLPDVFGAELEILSASINGNEVAVGCNQHNTAFNYCGGILAIDCQDINIYDQANNKLSIELLSKICKEYWDRAELE